MFYLNTAVFELTANMLVLGRYRRRQRKEEGCIEKGRRR